MVFKNLNMYDSYYLEKQFDGSKLEKNVKEL